ncbi:MAG: hypothetical protein PHV05_07735 [Candidatus Riflebacteria bacterium]|nr:hypothetical protein [Candidatus Riflebacteria bacterium]
MVECPKSALEIIQRIYPMIKAVKWNSKKCCFEIFEEISQNAMATLRRITDYQNYDGTPLPFIADTALDLLRRTDTRLWPLEDRMKLFDKEDEDFEKHQEKELKDYVGAVIHEDYNYIAGIPTFFMGPDMQVGRARYRPEQERILKKYGAI